MIDSKFSANLELAITNDDPSSSPSWSSWIPFQVGDYTARAFKTRLRLVGTPPGVTPIVEEVNVVFDMPDRTYGFSATVSTSGSTITFNPAFYAIPEIGIAVLNGQEGDTYTITNRSVSGFEIAFTNSSNPVERNITGLAKAYGAKEAT